VCAVKPKDSIRYIRSYSDSESVKREEYMLIQTPQIFDLDVLKNAYQNQPYQAAFTDDASVAEANGIRIQLCEGDYRNIKITTPEDLLLAEVLIHQFT
jgi:2-C-methyl-D-erythritol 4-phosphate cytidylyltransferase